ncbi:DUF1648 domain-containing protein [Paenalkalicoccus suaedae]|uniref:DUF1648 domain-containing protein n=1 Tax=Paenalkalicoccus suaedae TaxID=2592382 RepID=A0A859FBX5_9BACI|nr:DUF1648 domain-containing protein [Paenalkalicoccus suaedae]QKS70044.1 DUF1648 domain-containing protein [Paenalkalicoccus suaedae]
MKRLYTWMDVFAFLIFFAISIYVWRIYPTLPDQVPQHFNAAGEVTSWANKSSLLGLLAIYLAMILLLLLLQIFLLKKQEDPKKAIQFINIPFIEKDKLTFEQAEVARTYSKLMISLLNLLISFMFAYLLYSLVQTALGLQEGLNEMFLIYISLIVLAPIYISYKMVRQINSMKEELR